MAASMMGVRTCLTGSCIFENNNHFKRVQSWPIYVEKIIIEHKLTVYYQTLKKSAFTAGNDTANGKEQESLSTQRR